MSRVWSVWRRGWNENESGVPLSSDAALAACRPDRSHVVRWVSLLFAPMPNIDRRKIGILLIHMSAGMLIFALMAARFIVRMRMSRPVDARTGNLLPALGQERNNWPLDVRSCIALARLLGWTSDIAIRHPEPACRVRSITIFRFNPRGPISGTNCSGKSQVPTI